VSIFFLSFIVFFSSLIAANSIFLAVQNVFLRQLLFRGESFQWFKNVLKNSDMSARPNTPTQQLTKANSIYLKKYKLKFFDYDIFITNI